MRLSDAMAMGRVTIENLESGQLRGCVLGMACNAVGIKLINRQPLHAYADIYERWPWLYNRLIWRGAEDEAMGHIYTAFDREVMTGLMTLDELIDWVHSVEPAEEEVSEQLQTVEPEQTTVY